MLAEHRPPRGRSLHPDPIRRRATLSAAPELAGYVAALKQRSRKMLTLALRRLPGMVRDYPREPLLAAVAEAARYGLYDLDRLDGWSCATSRATTSCSTHETALMKDDDLTNCSRTSTCAASRRSSTSS